MRRAAAGLVLLVGIAGCRTVLPPQPPLAAEDPRPAALLARLESHTAELDGVRGTARVSVDGQRGASFAKQLVLAERPAKLRVEVLGLLNQRVAVLATDGVSYQLYRAEHGGLETGDVRPSVLLEVAGLPLTPEEAVALLLGTPRAGPRGMRVGSAAALADGGVRIVLADPAEVPRRSLEFDASGQLRRYALHGADGALLVDVRYDDVRAVGELPFAHRIALDFPSTGARAEVAFRKVELNPPLPGTVFRLELPGTPPS